MPLIAALAAACVLQTAVDPYALPIGRSGTATVAPGQLVDLRTNRPATVDDIVAAAKGRRFVYLGEQHATTAHQAMHATVIRALAAAGRQVAIGLEMYTRPKQDALDAWTLGQLDEAAFLEQSDWKGQWGFEYAYYRPIFEAAKELKLPVVALNVPRDWVRNVGRKGFDGLGVAAKLQLPAKMDLGNRAHRDVFAALLGGHPMTGTMGDNMYAAQVLWDEGMADTALKYLERTPTSPETVFVVAAGIGHLMYGQGINWRIERRKGGKGVTVSMIQADGPVQVSRGLGDFVYVSAAEPKD